MTESGGLPNNEVSPRDAIPEGHTNRTISRNQTATAQFTIYCRQLHLRRAASRRLPILDHLGLSDPWHYGRPAAGYPEAAEHLLGLGLLPAADRDGLRVMYRRGGSCRQAAKVIAQAWGLTT
jgi:hypothetical protein